MDNEIKTTEEISGATVLEPIDVDQSEIENTSRMTEDYQQFLKEKMDPEEVDRLSRTIPVPEDETDKKRKSLELAINNQRRIIESNKGLSIRKYKTRKQAKEKLKELTAEYDSLS